MNFGCSSFSWKTKDGRHLLGRTYDQLGDLRANRVICVPKGSPCLPGFSQPGGRSRYTMAIRAWRCWDMGNPSL